MMNKIHVVIASEEDILKTLENVYQLGGNTCARYANVEHELEIPQKLWELCGKVLEVSDVRNETHEYAYRVFLFDNNDEDNGIPIVYFMENWLSLVTTEKMN